MLIPNILFILYVNQFLIVKIETYEWNSLTFCHQFRKDWFTQQWTGIWKKFFVVLKLSIKRIESRKNTGSVASRQIYVRFAKFVWRFMVALVSSPSKNLFAIWSFESQLSEVSFSRWIWKNLCQAIKPKREKTTAVLPKPRVLGLLDILNISWIA